MARKAKTIADFYSENPDYRQVLTEQSFAKFSGHPKSYAGHVDFLCLDCGHIYSAKAKGKLHRKAGCPCCNGHVVVEGINDLGSSRPDLAAQWHPDNNKKPNEVTTMSGYMAKWVCPCDRKKTWVAMVGDRSRAATAKCGECASFSARRKPYQESSAKEGLLLPYGHRVPGVIRDQLDEDLDSPVSMNSKRVLRWKCDKGHSFKRQARLHDGACPACDSAKNSLATIRPDIAREWSSRNDKSPEEVSYNSACFAWWECEEGHQWQAAVYQRVNSNTGCSVCWRKSGGSRAEREVRDFICEALGGNIEVHNNVRGLVGNYEADIYVPSARVVVEYNGLYWHSEDKGKGKDYHASKAQAFMESGYTFIVVWEDDWLNRRQVVQKMLRHKLGVSTDRAVYARKTSVDYKVDTREARVFCEENHLRGYTPGSLYVGLREASGDLVALAVVRKNGDVATISRYCTSLRVVGGMGKLLAAIEMWAKDNAISKVITFSDYAVSVGDLYRKTGFSCDGVIPPDYSYVVGGKRVHKFNFRKRRFRLDATLKYEDGLTERELAALNGLSRVWGCGKIRWAKAISG